MSVAAAVKLGDAYDASKDVDDSIAEIDAMIPRLVAMRNQLLAQKEYIDVATADALASDNINAQDAMLGVADVSGTPTKGEINTDKSGKNAKIVDYRIGLFKHQGKVQRISYNKGLSGSLLENTDNYGLLAKAGSGSGFTPGTTSTSDVDVDRGSKRRGGKGAIFKKNEKIAATADGEPVEIEKKDANGSFKGVDLQGTKKFLIGVNAMLTQPNNIDEIGEDGSGYKDAINGIDELQGTYEPGGKHIISAGTLRGLLMKGNKNTPAGDADKIGEILGGSVSSTTDISKLKAIRGFGL